MPNAVTFCVTIQKTCSETSCACWGLNSIEIFAFCDSVLTLSPSRNALLFSHQIVSASTAATPKETKVNCNINGTLLSIWHEG